MKLTYNWLKDFVEIRLPAKELAHRLTMAGLEVTSLERKDKDWVLEIEVTPNRPDLLSVLGIAREVAAITGKKLSSYPVNQLSCLDRQTGKPANRLTINIQDKQDCPLYTAKIIKDITVAPSPSWLKERLELVGLRSVNNIVDITNYVQLSLGQPLHTFDLHRIEQNTIFVRRAKQGEKIVTIDGQELMLNEEILVIADSQRPIAIAGIMGGKDTEVGQGTKNILLESAKFAALIIRRARQKLGLFSESSYRFERDIDINGVEPASVYATRLISEIAGGRFSHAKARGRTSAKQKKLTLNIPNIERILGLTIPQRDINRILNSLDFRPKQISTEVLEIQPPTFRRDIALQIDVIEELARHWGYQRIPVSLPKIRPSAEGYNMPGLIKIVKQVLTNQGSNEVITYSLISRNILERSGLDSTEAIEIINPLSGEHELLRPRLLPSLLICLGRNINLEESVSIFEISNVFSKQGERLSLGIGLCGERWLYTSRGRIKDQMGLFHLKGMIELLFRNLGIEDYDLVLQDEDRPYFAKGRAINLRIGPQEVGYFGQIKERISEDFDIKNRPVFMAELCLDKMLSGADLNKIFKPLPLYPSVRRDISLIIREDISTQDLLNSIKLNAAALLKEIKVVDYYKGKQIPSGFKGLTLSCLYLSQERTLTDEEVNTIHITICDSLKQKFQAQIR